MRARRRKPRAATGEPSSEGRIRQPALTAVVRRASFFGPSPAANLVGVEEGHPCVGVSFLCVSQGYEAITR
jgi:hypothetical protein